MIFFFSNFYLKVLFNHSRTTTALYLYPLPTFFLSFLVTRPRPSTLPCFNCKTEGSPLLPPDCRILAYSGWDGPLSRRSLAWFSELSPLLLDALTDVIVSSVMQPCNRPPTFFSSSQQIWITCTTSMLLHHEVRILIHYRQKRKIHTLSGRVFEKHWHWSDLSKAI